MENDPNLLRSPYSSLLRHTPPSSENVPNEKIDHLKSAKKSFQSSPKLIGLSCKENSLPSEKRSYSLPSKKLLFSKDPVNSSDPSIPSLDTVSEPTDHVYQSLDAAHQAIRHLESIVKETLEEKKELEEQYFETMALLKECELLLEQKEEEETLLQLQHERDEALIQELQEALQETLLFCEHLEDLKDKKSESNKKQTCTKGKK